MDEKALGIMGSKAPVQMKNCVFCMFFIFSSGFCVSLF